MVAQPHFKTQRPPAHLTAIPHLLTGIACLSLFSLAMTGDVGYRWWWNTSKLLGAAAAIESVVLYRK